MNELRQILKQLYPVSHQTVYKEIGKLLPSKASNPIDKNWHKAMNLYVSYPDSFEKNGESNLYTFSEKVEYIKKLGFNAIHILPFLDSPMIDGGFDIKNYVDIRENLGGMNALNEVIAQCKKHDVRIFMDMVMNHISDQHEWFQRALNGEVKYRNYFLHQEEKPILVKKYEDERGHWAEYDFNGKITPIRIIFPEFVKELPHWIQGSDGFWYYHTFYQYQIDLNWYNPDVFIEFLQILKFWSDKGLNFRLDAITFLAKDLKSGIIESNPNLHLILKALNIILERINPNSVFLAETCQPVEIIKEYFGTNKIPESEIVYNFKMMQSIWISYLQKNPEKIYETIIQNFQDIPVHAGWVNFLRNHDELTLEFMKEENRSLVYDSLIKSGLSFRDGFGISGRTMNFVGGNANDLIFLYKVLASLPGTAALIYGDEVGKSNEEKFMEQQVKYKLEDLKLENVKRDTRDINRGTLYDEEIKNPLGKEIYRNLADIFNKRLSLLRFFKNGLETKIVNNTLVLKYTLKNETLEIKIDFENRECEWGEARKRSIFSRLLNVFK